MMHLGHEFTCCDRACACSAALPAACCNEGCCGACAAHAAQVSYGAGAYICGEETALLESLEGKQVSNGPWLGMTGAVVHSQLTGCVVVLICQSSAVCLTGACRVKV